MRMNCMRTPKQQRLTTVVNINTLINARVRKIDRHCMRIHIACRKKKKKKKKKEKEKEKRKKKRKL